MAKPEVEEDKKYDVRVVISSLGSEKRTIRLGECSEEDIQKIVATVNAAFGTVRASQSLMLTDRDGIVVFANLDNIAFVEVNVGS